jgi:thymidylate kinase
VEFVGLPGCGKSTLAARLEKQLCADGYPAQGMRNATRTVSVEIQDKVGFLRRRGERASLYGCFVFAHENPKLFEWMFRTSHDDFVALIWGMEALSQIGILQKHGPKDLIILNDEGFMQRVSWNLMELGDGPELAEVIALLPADFLTVHMVLPPAQAYARTQDRRKGVPAPLRGETDAQAVEKFERYEKMLRRSANIRQSLGHRVIELDASQDEDSVITEALAALKPLLTRPVEVAKPKKRKLRK